MFCKIKLYSKPILLSIKRSYETIANKSVIITKSDAKNRILSAKNECNLTFEGMAQKLTSNKVFLTSAIYGEHPFDRLLALDTLKLIGINDSKEMGTLLKVMQQIPDIRADNQTYANDPLISRLYEMIRIYGPTFRALIHEMCGNGIMSAIDCSLDCDKYIDKSSNSERIVIKIDGKFLKYKHLK